MEPDVHDHLKADGKIGRINVEVFHYAIPSVRRIFERTLIYTSAEAVNYCRIQKKVSCKEIRYRLTWRALKTFYKLYIKKRGFMDGLPGLVWCVCNTIGPQIRWLMIWEEAHRQKKLVD